MHQVAGWLAGEAVAVEFGGQQIAAVDRHAAGRCDLTFVQRRRGPRAADGIDPRLFAGR